MPVYRSRTTTHGRNMAGARGLWRATGMKDGDFGKPIIAVVNSFTQFVPGHVHLKDLGQLVAREIEAAGGALDGFNFFVGIFIVSSGHHRINQIQRYHLARWSQIFASLHRSAGHEN